MAVASAIGSVVAQLPDVPEIILDEPVLTMALVVIIGVVLQYTRGVGPRRAIFYETLRLWAFRALDPLTKRIGHRLLRDKTASGEQIATVDGVELVDLARAMWAEGLRWNPTSTKKFVRAPGLGKLWASLSVAYRSEGMQNHYYVIVAPDGTLDVRGHREASVTEPDEHLGGGQEDGYVGDRLRAALEQLEADGASVEWASD